MVDQGTRGAGTTTGKRLRDAGDAGDEGRTRTVRGAGEGWEVVFTQVRRGA